MSQVYTIGRVTADLELQTSTNMNSYIRFGLAEHIGYGESQRTQFLQVWAWEDDAKRLIKGKVKKGSLIWVSGPLELEEYTKQDGITRDKRLKIIMDNWGYVPVGKTKSSESDADIPDDVAAETGMPESRSHVRELDGDRENLPG